MIGRKSLLIVISTLLSSILAFVGLLAMTNYLGTDAYGTISWVLATLTTLNVVSDMGFGSAHIKRLSEGQDQSDCVSTYIVVKIILIAFMVFFVLAVLLVWNNVLGGSISPATWNLTILFVLYFVMYDLSSIAVNTFTAKMETTKTQLVALIDPFIRVPLIVLISVNRLPSDLAYGYVFAAMGVMLLSLFLLKRSDFKWKRPTLFRSYLKFALPISMIAISGAVTPNLDRILIGYFYLPANVAYYSAAQTLLTTLGVIGSAVATLTFPAFSKMHSDGDIESIRKVTFAAERYIMMIVIPIVTLTVLFPTEIMVTLFGSHYLPAGDSLRFLTIDVALSLFGQVYISQIYGVNRPDISAKIILATFIINVILFFIFIPQELFGVRLLGLSNTGAAIASAIAAILVLILVRLIINRLTGTGINPRIMRHILAGAFAGLIIISLNTVYRFSGVIALVIFAGVTLLAFYGALAALKEFTRADINYFRDLISPSKMFSYMGEEMKNKK
jgi:O-antigen/teichoic acid export membrane protein